MLAKAKTQVATDEEAAKACAERAEVVKAKIADGNEAAEFKKKISDLNPMGTIRYKAETLKEAATRKTGRVFEPYGDVIHSRDEAKRLVTQFAMMSSDYIAELTAELESVINQEVMGTGKKLLAEYQEKLFKIDESAADKKLDFDTVDLIKGALGSMKENAEKWCSDDFAEETVDDMGEETVEEEVSWNKVGQKEEQVFDGFEEVKSGSRRVWVGSHKERIGSHKVEKAPEGLLGKIAHFFGKREYTYEDDYKEVDDYKDEDIYEKVAKYKTVMKDIFEEQRKQVTKFSVDTAVIQTGLVSKLRRNLDEGIEKTLDYASDQIDRMKKQFTDLFDELNLFIKEKYTELEQCANDQKTKEEELEKNKKLLLWVERSKEEIDNILNI